MASRAASIAALVVHTPIGTGVLVAVGVMVRVGVGAGTIPRSNCSTVVRVAPVPLIPPMAYSLPLSAAASPSSARAVGIAGQETQVLLAGSYCSTVAKTPGGELLPPGSKPPTAYSLPLAAPATPSSTRAVGIAARDTQ